MNKIITTAGLAVALIGARVQTAEARGGDCAVGAVLGGIVAGAIIADAFQPHTTYYSAPSYCPPPAPVYYQPCYPPARVVYAAPAPVYYYSQPAPVVVYREPAVRFGFGYVRPWGHGHGYGYGHCR